MAVRSVPRRVHHLGEVHVVAGIPEDVVVRRAAVRFDSQVGLRPVEAVVALGNHIPVVAVGPAIAVIPHPIPVPVLLRQNGSVHVGEVRFPRLVRLQDGVGRDLLELVIGPRDVGLLRNDVIVDKELPGPGEIDERLLSARGGG